MPSYSKPLAFPEPAHTPHGFYAGHASVQLVSQDTKGAVTLSVDTGQSLLIVEVSPKGKIVTVTLDAGLIHGRFRPGGVGRANDKKRLRALQAQT